MKQRERERTVFFFPFERPLLFRCSPPLLFFHSSSPAKKKRKKERKRSSLSFLSFLFLSLPAMSLAFDEYGRPFIIIRVRWRDERRERRERRERKRERERRERKAAMNVLMGLDGSRRAHPSPRLALPPSRVYFSPFDRPRGISRARSIAARRRCSLTNAKRAKARLPDGAFDVDRRETRPDVFRFFSSFSFSRSVSVQPPSLDRRQSLSPFSFVVVLSFLFLPAPLTNE